MRSIAIFVLVAMFAFTNAVPVEEHEEGTLLYYGAKGTTENSLKFPFNDPEARCCTSSLCRDICIAFGFRAPFAYRCNGCNVCECVQL